MRENHSVAVEPEPCDVQVVERVGLVASGFQFFTRLAVVFTEEADGCLAVLFDYCVVFGARVAGVVQGV